MSAEQQASNRPRVTRNRVGKILLASAFLGVTIFILSSKNAPPPPPITGLLYQGATEDGLINDSRVTLAKYRVDEPFQKVVQHYVAHFTGGVIGDPTMMTAGIRLFKTWLGFRSTILTGSERRPVAASKTMIRQTNNAIYFVHVSCPSTNGPDSILISSFRFAARRGEINSFPPGFEYPNVVRGSAGGGGSLMSQRYTTSDSFDDVWRYYQAKLSLRTNVVGGAVVPLVNKAKRGNPERNYVALFPETDSPDLRERAFLHFEDEKALFVTVSRGKDDDKTHIIMNAISW